MIEEEQRIRAGSEVHLDEWVTPEIADDHGYIRAGKILEWMDVVGVLAATRHCRRPVVTASIDGMELQKPIRVGERVAMTASIAFTSARSIGVSVAMRHGAPDDATPPTSVGAYMTFVALDEEGNSLPVPQFQAGTPSEVARFREGRLRSEFRKKMMSGQLPDLDAANAPQPENPLFIRELLKLLPRSLQLPFDRTRASGERRRHLSYVHKIEPIRGGKLNFHGTLYGGTLMRWIESSAQLSARSHLHGAPVRLVGLHGLTFIRPVAPHVFIHVRSAIAHTAADSLTALVNVHAEDPTAGRQTETLRAFLTYAPVAANGTGEPVIRALECIGDEELGLFKEVEHRLALQRTLRDGVAGALKLVRSAPADVTARESR
jgi:acyl-CoA hydrolase